MVSVAGNLVSEPKLQFHRYNSHDALFICGDKSAPEMVRLHALLVLMLMSGKNFFAQVFLELLDKSTCFFSTRKLEVVQKRKVEIERIEDLRLDLRLHL